jgi:hypothetical protein
MFEKKFEERLRAWHDFRESLSDSQQPIQSAIDFWNLVPTARRNIDPYDQTTWPDPWQMIEENSYCEFTKTLAVAYTLKLTSQYRDWQPVFKVGVDKSESRLYYMCILDDIVLGYDQDKSVHIDEIPKSIHIEKVIELPELY